MLVFSTHAFTEGDVAVGVGVGMAAISTHAFTEGDCKRTWYRTELRYFNSRLHGRRRAVRGYGRRRRVISTHAFMEGDCKFK